MEKVTNFQISDSFDYLNSTNKLNDIENFNLILFTTEFRKNKVYKLKRYFINWSDIIKITNNNEQYKFNKYSDVLCPKYIENFEKYISTFIKTVFDLENINLISSEEYINFCLKRFELYKEYKKTYYKDEIEKICNDFYDMYIPKKLKKSFPNFEELIIRGNFADWGCVKTDKTGGEFYGCYQDEYGRKRPLTTPIQYIKKIDYETILKVFIQYGIQKIYGKKEENRC